MHPPVLGRRQRPCGPWSAIGSPGVCRQLVALSRGLVPVAEPWPRPPCGQCSHRPWLGCSVPAYQLETPMNTLSVIFFKSGCFQEAGFEAIF